MRGPADVRGEGRLLAQAGLRLAAILIRSEVHETSREYLRMTVLLPIGIGPDSIEPWGV